MDLESYLDSLVYEAVRTFITAHKTNTLVSIRQFIDNYPKERHKVILDAIETYLELEAFIATVTVDDTVLAAVISAQHIVLNELDTKHE